MNAIAAISVDKPKMMIKSCSIVLRIIVLKFAGHLRGPAYVSVIAGLTGS